MSVLDLIQGALSGNDASVRVDAQAGNVLNVGSLLGSLSENPPAAVAGLQQAFGQLELPAFPLSGFVTRIADVRAAVPGDTSGVLGGVLGDLGRMDEELGGALATSLRNALVAFEKVKALADIDFSCAGAIAGTNGGAPSTPPPAPEPPAPEPPPAPPAAVQPTALATAATQANAVLDLMPTPFNLRALLLLFHRGTAFRRTELIPAILPLLDDLRDPIDTLILWESLTPAQILAEIATSLGQADALVRTGVERTIAPLFTQLNALLSAVPSADLQRIAERLTIRLGELKTAVQSSDVSGTGAATTEINALLDEYDVLRPTLVPVFGPAPELRTRLGEVAADLDLGMASMISILKPGGSLLLRVPQVQLDTLGTLEIWLQGLADWLNDIASVLDLSVIQAPIAAVANTLGTVANGLQQAVVTVTVQVQSVFTQVQSLLDTLDPDTMQAEVEALVQQFRTTLISRINALVAPARDAVMAAVAGIDAAVDAFDPGDVVAAITDAITALETVLTEGEIGQAITAVRDGLERVATELSALSFTPTADAVISAIDGIRAALEAIDPALLPKPATDALKSAASVLPQDLEPITKPIIDEFGAILDAGPTPILEAVRAAPKELIEAVRNFDPASLVGAGLSAPFQDVLRALEDFRPSELLDPVERQFEEFKEQLKRAASPGQAAQALEAPFQQLRSAIEAFDPNELIDPLDEALSAVTEKLLDILPVNETFAVIDYVLAVVQRVLDTMDSVVTLMRRVRETANSLVDVRGQLEAWVDQVLDKIDGLDTSSLTPLLATLQTTLDGTRAAGVQARFTAASAGARSTLDALNGSTRLAALIQAQRGVPRPALQALPASAQKTAITNALNRFDPLLPEFGAPWQQMGELRQALLDGDAALQVLAPVWDDRFHATGGSLDDLRQAQATPAQLRAWAQESFEANLIAPLAHALGFLEPVRQVINAFVTPFEELVTSVQQKLVALLLGPESIGAIRTSLAQIADTIAALDLDFLRTSVNGLFNEIKEKLDELSPAALAEALDRAFATVLDAIDIDLILPPADVALIDETYHGVVDKLRLLDPSTIVEDVVKPLFEEQIVPLIERFDVAPFLETIVDRLGVMDDELNAELARVNEAYRKLLGALPEGGSQSASVSVSVAA